MQLQACKNLASKGQDEIDALTAEREVLFALITLIFLVMLVNPHFFIFLLSSILPCAHSSSFADLLLCHCQRLCFLVTELQEVNDLEAKRKKFKSTSLKTLQQQVLDLGGLSESQEKNVQEESLGWEGETGEESQERALEERGSDCVGEGEIVEFTFASEQAKIGDETSTFLNTALELVQPGVANSTAVSTGIGKQSIEEHQKTDDMVHKHSGRPGQSEQSVSMSLF
jgi:hypothetical protein